MCATDPEIEWIEYTRFYIYLKQVLRSLTATNAKSCTNYRPPEGGRLYDMKVVSGYAFLRTYYVQKKLTANHAAAISHKH